MRQFTVTGMSCAACSARVEKAVLKVPGVTSCTVSLLTNSMVVEGSAEDKVIIDAVVKAGFKAKVKNEKKKTSNENIQSEKKDTETAGIVCRLLLSIGFLLVLMYFSMGYVMLGFPLPSFFEGNPVAVGMVQLLLALIVIFINKKFYVNGIKGVLHRAPNMDTLVSMGSASAFIYSIISLFQMTSLQASGNFDSATKYLHELYFESSAMILVLITVGKMLESYSKGKTTNALKGLMDLAPKTATIFVDGKETSVQVSRVKKGDVFVVRSGESIPVDGVVIDGMCAVNESSLTGESIPVEKQNGSIVYSGTISQTGYIKCEATKVGEDTTLSQIIKMVSDASATKAPIAKVADKVSGIFVPAVICIAIITVIIWLLVGHTFGYALARGISVLVISCPCALGLATPVAIMVGSGVGAKNGILFKNAVSLEQTGKTKIVVLDKTGTITNGTPVVTDIIPTGAYNSNSLIKLAAAIEAKSEHPLAKAVMNMAKNEGVLIDEVTDFNVFPGNGIEAKLYGKTVCTGNYSFIKEKAEIDDEIFKKAETLSNKGKTPIYFVEGEKLAGIIAVSDTVKDDSPEAVRELQNMDIRVVMLTGDNEKTANAIGTIAGVDEVIAGVLPSGKENVIKMLKEQGVVLMVGDGINDAPALTRADIGMAIGAGADIAIDSADIVLVKSRLTDVPAAIRLSRATLKNIHQNLFWAFIYNTIGIPLAAGVFIALLGWQLNPMFGAAAMSLSSFCVVTNALRLNFFKVHSKNKQK